MRHEDHDKRSVLIDGACPDPHCDKWHGPKLYERTFTDGSPSSPLFYEGYGLGVDPARRYTTRVSWVSEEWRERGAASVTWWVWVRAKP